MGTHSSGIKAPVTSGCTSITMHVYGEDVDAVVERAKSVGAHVVMEPHDAFWGSP